MNRKLGRLIQPGMGMYFVVMLAFRALVMTVGTIEGDGLAPQFVEGDRVMFQES